ncbi:MAG TPA: aminotransferase class IV [Kofleriaceae bacterium]|jgi:branched-chain amino acid aminotransferase|nr:aminotransferase class IV [Kofleriaceae bacterium]
MAAVSIDGVLVAAEHASISVFDRGLLYGDGCFEVLRTWGGIARDLDAHLDRLFATAAFLQMKTIERSTLVQAVHRTIAAAGPGEHRLRIVLTRGPGGLAVRLAELGPGTAIVIVEPLPEPPEAVALATVAWPLPRREGRGHKTLAYLDHVIARELARAQGADEALRLDADGHAIEGASCNIFAVSAGSVMTPPIDTGALPGIVRGRVLALCGEVGVRVAVRPLTLDDVRGADELFVTSSLRGVVPVTWLDGTLRSSGRITARLARAYVDAMRVASEHSDL